MYWNLNSTFLVIVPPRLTLTWDVLKSDKTVCLAIGL